MGKLRSRDGNTVISGLPALAPAPVRDIVTGFSSGSLDGILILLVNVSIDFGENLIVIVQPADGDNVWAEQLSNTLLNGEDGFVIVPMVRLAFPSFLTDTLLSELESTFTLPKGRVMGVAVISGAVVSVLVVSVVSIVHE